jgi:serine/threonine-protein kinase
MMQQRRKASRRDSCAGFTNQQALLALLITFPLGLIGIGLILNVASEIPSQKTRGATTAPSTQPPAARTPAKHPSTTIQSNEHINKQGVLELGQSANGAPIRLILNSINDEVDGRKGFAYQLGNTTILAKANCQEGSWISYPEQQLNRPQSPATERMITRVCEGTTERALPGVAIVHNPPSNVRTAPNGAFLCTIDSRRTIRVGQPSGDWYPTSECGSEGYIHRSQLQF